jgi:SAM-dependent methyltransferase
MASGDPRVDQWNAWAAIERDVQPGEDPAACLALLTALAAGGSALELGPGGGRIAIPLARSGLNVTALDFSSQVSDALRAKAAGLPLTTVVADMADFSLPVSYDLVFSTWSTFFALLTQNEQVGCLRSVAKVINPAGHLVLDVFSPIQDQNVLSRQGWTVRSLAEEHVDISLTRHDPVQQRIRFQEIRFSRDQTRMVPVDIRYAWPSEIDLMAQIAGLRLTARYGGWDREPFTGRSFRNISVYQPQP